MVHRHRLLAAVAGIAGIAVFAVTVSAQRLRPADVDALPAPPADARVTYGADPLQFGDLRLPAGKGPFPVAVVVHGGCWVSTFATLQNTTALSDALRDAGIATWNSICGMPVIEQLLGGPPAAVPARYAEASPAALLPLGVKQVLIVGASASARCSA